MSHGARRWSGVVTGEIEIIVTEGSSQRASTYESFDEVPGDEDGDEGDSDTSTSTSTSGGGGRDDSGSSRIQTGRRADAPRAARHRTVRVPVRVRIVPTPPRHRRLLVDTYHTSSYPGGFFPTDNLAAHADELMDMRGDHPHTNYRSLAARLRSEGFHLETLSSNLTTIDAAQYGALLLIDSEELFLPQEEASLLAMVRTRGLNLVVVSDWYDPAMMAALYYEDEHAGEKHHCGSGGSNVPALNQLLAPLGIALRTDAVYSGAYTVRVLGVRVRVPDKLTHRTRAQSRSASRPVGRSASQPASQSASQSARGRATYQIAGPYNSPH